MVHAKKRSECHRKSLIVSFLSRIDVRPSCIHHIKLHAYEITRELGKGGRHNEREIETFEPTYVYNTYSHAKDS